MNDDDVMLHVNSAFKNYQFTLDFKNVQKLSLSFAGGFQK